MDHTAAGQTELQLVFNDTVVACAADGTAADLKAALEALDNVDAVEVTITPDWGAQAASLAASSAICSSANDRWVQVTFIGAAVSGPAPALAVPSSASSLVTVTQRVRGTLHEVTAVTCVDDNTGSADTFTLSVAGGTTGALPDSAAAVPGEDIAASLRDALEALPSISQADVRVVEGASPAGAVPASTLCAASPGNTMVITFTDRATLGTFRASWARQGTEAVISASTAGSLTLTPSRAAAAGWSSYGDLFVGINYVWDADRLTSCKCSRSRHAAGSHMSTAGDASPYAGLACDGWACPTGVDPRATSFTGHSDRVEVQELQCSATAGSWQLELWGMRTVAIQASSTAEDVQAALRALPGLDRVQVTSSSPALCSAGGSTTQVTFLGYAGDVPYLHVLPRALASGGTSETFLRVAEVQRGAGSRAVCSNRGKCLDYEDEGICRCARGYVSSNGNAQPGSLGDCGAEVSGHESVYDALLYERGYTINP